jgi:flagellar hook-associated protein 1 FlgK
MPGLNSSLNIGLSGLQAAQGALNVVGHNIANVNTPNYSRQRVTLSNNVPQVFGTLAYGTGVNLQNILGVRDKFLEMQITQSTSRQQGAAARYAGIEGISGVFEDDGLSGLSTLVQNFFQSFQQLSTRPEDGALRTNTIGQANSLVNGLKSRYQLLEDQRTQANKSVSSLVQEVNTLTSQIASLNERISSEPSPGADSDGRDQRQALTNQLASLVGIQVFEDNRNRLQITLDSGAAVLVSGNAAYAMTATPDATLDNNHVRVDVLMGGAPVDVTRLVKEGTLGANLDLRDTILKGYESTLDELAAGITGQTNMTHRTGFSLDGLAVAGTAWEDFFHGANANDVNGLPILNLVTVNASNHYRGMVNAMTVNQRIVDDPNRIAAADAAGSPGNNMNARALANLQNAANTVNTATTAVVGPNGADAGNSGPFSTVVSSLINTVGTNVQGYETASTGQDNLLSALRTQRDRVSAVDMDEEATALLSFQRSYQASAHFISVIDQLTAQLMTQFAV